MTIEKLIEEYNKKISNSKDKEITINGIVKKVIELKYEDGRNVSNETKIQILTEVRKNILKESTQKFAQDNTKHLEIIAATISKLKGEK